MSASLVGSEMCIRDSANEAVCGGLSSPGAAVKPVAGEAIYPGDAWPMRSPRGAPPASLLAASAAARQRPPAPSGSRRAASA
eukprot:3784185-Alexandrium_andersonii.AAC.1